jgi:hypothetical protein
VNYYPHLARALLESGDTEQSIIAFLRAEYGLDRAQAKAAIVLARYTETESVTRRREEQHTPSGARH